MSDEPLTAPHRLLGTFVRRRRIALGLTQKDLEQRTGIHQETISKIELGRTPDPRLTTVTALARGLEVEASDLFDIMEGRNKSRPATVQEAAAEYRRQQAEIAAEKSDVVTLLQQLGPEERRSVEGLIRTWVASAERRRVG